MARGVNKCILVGTLGADVELRQTENNRSVANFSIATNEVWTSEDGTRHERTEWHKVVVWGKTADNCSKYLAKGRSVYVEGPIRTRKWTDKDNNERNVKEVIASTVQFLDKPSE